MGCKCVQGNRQKIHFSFHPDYRCYSKNERLGRLPYYYINFFSFHFVSTATLNCNFFYFSVYHHNLIFTHCFCRGLQWGLHKPVVYCSFPCNKPHVWGSCCRHWWRVFYKIRVLKLFLWIMRLSKFNNVSNFFFYCKKKKKKRNKVSRNHVFKFFSDFKKQNWID